MNSYLSCRNNECEPNVIALKQAGKPEELIKGVMAAREKMKTYLKIVLRSPLYSIGTSRLNL